MNRLIVFCIVAAVVLIVGLTAERVGVNSQPPTPTEPAKSVTPRATVAPKTPPPAAKPKPQFCHKDCNILTGEGPEPCGNDCLL